MKVPRYAASRQKACKHCSTAKAKCDRKAGGCTRCTLRGLTCIYPHTLPSGCTGHGIYSNVDAAARSPLSPSNTLSTSESFRSSSECEQPARTDPRSFTIESPHSLGDNSQTITPSASCATSHVSIDLGLDDMRSVGAVRETLDFSGLELLCPINASDIRNRWLNPYIPVPGQKIKQYSTAITNFIDRILKSYVTITVRGRGLPPFVHPLQMATTSIRPPLATCLTLVRICENVIPGSDSVAADVLKREMTSLHQQHATYDNMTLLSAFQAYLIYSMVLFFTLNQRSNPFLRQAVVNLQDLACSSSQRGLICVAERQRARPKWEAWIVAEAQRRTLFAMYLFDSLLSAQDNLPTFLGTELQGLPAPANKGLWRAQTQHKWEAAYNVHLADWVEGGLNIDELWPSPTHLGESALLKRRQRVEQWLENVDEFGTMLYAVTSCTHGG